MTIVAYTYNADIYCPTCIPEVVYPGVSTRWGWSSTESVLDAMALGARINRYDERTFDSGEFPKVVFANMIHEAGSARCGNCHKKI